MKTYKWRMDVAKPTAKQQRNSVELDRRIDLLKLALDSEMRTASFLAGSEHPSLDVPRKNTLTVVEEIVTA